MSTSRAQATAELANALPSQVGNEAPTSSSLAQVEPFNFKTRQAFYLMLDSRKELSCERVTPSQKHQYARWLTESIPEQLDGPAGKKRAWVKSEFAYDQGELEKSHGYVPMTLLMINHLR